MDTIYQKDQVITMFNLMLINVRFDVQLIPQFSVGYDVVLVIGLVLDFRAHEIDPLRSESAKSDVICFFCQALQHSHLSQ